MTKDEALNVIKQACAVYRGTLQEHQLIQEALKLLGPEPEKPVAQKTED